MNRSLKENIVINKDYNQLTVFLNKLPELFLISGNTIYKGRNTIKTFEVEKYSLNVKSFKIPHLLNQFVYATFRESKAKRSYSYAQRLLKLGIDTPAPIAYMEYKRPLLLKNSLYVSEHINVDGQLRVLQYGTIDEHIQLITAFAKFTAKVHKLKVLHLDYSSGNIMYTHKSDKFKFYLVDLNRMEFDKEIGEKKAAHNFRRLWGSDEMITLFARIYAEERGFDKDDFIHLVFKYRERFWKNFNRQYPDVRPYEGIEKIKIGYDAKRATLNFTGLGNYSRFIIKNIAMRYPSMSYFLYSPRPASSKTRKGLNGSNNITHVIKHGVKPFWRTKGIIKDIKNQKIDIYHGLSNELPVGIQHANVKSIVTIHDLIFRIHPHFYPFIDRVIYDIKARYACKHADKIIAVSECTKKDIIKVYGVEPSKIEVVYQGCFPDFATIASSNLKKEVKEKYQLPSNFILSVGSIEERKNILLIVKALKQIPDIHFVAIGRKRDYADEVEKYAREHNLSERVHLLTDISLEHLPAIFQLANIFIYPSIYEGFGIPLLEAQNSGLPVIAAKGSCLEEAGGPHSIYVDPYDENDLALAITKVLTDYKLREQMIEDGKEYVKQFSPEKCIDNLKAVYDNLLNK